MPVTEPLFYKGFQKLWYIQQQKIFKKICFRRYLSLARNFITIGKYLKLEIFFAIYAMNLANSIRHLIYHIKFFI